jgi:RND superfamily putative drug exporter
MGVAGWRTRVVTRHPKRVIAAALVVTAVAAAGSVSVADRLDPFAADDPASESVRAENVLEHAGQSAGVGVVALVRTPHGATGADGRARIAAAARALRADPDVTRVIGYPEGGRALVARDGRSTYLAASLRPGADEAEVGRRLIDRLGDRPDMTLGGFAVASRQVNEQTAKDLARAELLAFPLLFALTFLVFRSVVAALLPLLVGGMAIVLTMFGLRLGAEAGSISVFA